MINSITTDEAEAIGKFNEALKNLDDSDLKINGNEILKAITPYIEEHTKKVAIDFINWINDIGFQKYKEGWCQAGGSNGWHCTTEELYLRFREQDKPNNK